MAGETESIDDLEEIVKEAARKGSVYKVRRSTLFRDDVDWSRERKTWFVNVPGQDDKVTSGFLKMNQEIPAGCNNQLLYFGGVYCLKYSS